MLKPALIFAGLLTAARASSRCYYGQPCFPTAAELQAFNSTIGGRLVSILPLQAVCYVGPNVNASACGEVNANYSNDIYRCVARSRTPCCRTEPARFSGETT